MNNAISTFSELGRRLQQFGTDSRSREAIAQACRANGWFTPADIRRAVAAIADRMLAPDRLAAWAACYPLPVAEPRRVLVVMAGNIPLVGFFDLLCVLVAGHRCRVKPSSKDRALMCFVIDLLREIDPAVPVAMYEAGEPVDAVIATGGGNANRHFRSRYAGIPALLRGHRQSVAVLSGQETPEQLAALADDIWAYSGLGCRNVSLLFLPEGYEPALRMPAMNPKYRNNYRQERALLTLAGTPFRDLGAAVAVEQAEFPTALSRIAWRRYRSLDDVREWLTAHDAELQCVVSTCIDHSRRADFGQAQAPGLSDWPDDRDVLAFLEQL